MSEVEDVEMEPIPLIALYLLELVITNSVVANCVVLVPTGAVTPDVVNPLHKIPPCPSPLLDLS